LKFWAGYVRWPHLTILPASQQGLLHLRFNAGLDALAGGPIIRRDICRFKNPIYKLTPAQRNTLKWQGWLAKYVSIR